MTADFRIQTMEEVHQATQGAPSPPHRHSYYTLIWSVKAKGRHMIDFTEYELHRNSIFFVSPGQVHQLVAEGEPSGYVITFTPTFLAQNQIRPAFIADLHLFKEYGETPPLETDLDMIMVLKGYVDQMLHHRNQPSRFQADALGALLKLFLIRCYSGCEAYGWEETITATQSQHASTHILRSFKDLLNAHYKEEHAVAYYAEGLHITADHLNKTVKQLTAKTAKEFIQDKLTLEAKRMALEADVPAKEIAYALGFQEPAHFSAFFKKCTGLTLSQFRQQHQQYF